VPGIDVDERDVLGVGPAGRRVDGRDHRGDLIGERRRRIAVTLARQGDRPGAMAAGLELGGDVVPGRPVEPQARDQHDVHIGSPSPLRSRAPGGQRMVQPRR
jgi:hypothetical protein